MPKFKFKIDEGEISLLEANLSMYLPLYVISYRNGKCAPQYIPQMKSGMSVIFNFIDVDMITIILQNMN